MIKFKLKSRQYEIEQLSLLSIMNESNTKPIYNYNGFLINLIQPSIVKFIFAEGQNHFFFISPKDSSAKVATADKKTWSLMFYRGES